jgi:CHASE2 domain-containing sensor protein
MNPNHTAKPAKFRVAWRQLNNTPWRSFFIRLAVITLIVYLAAWTHALNIAGIDDWLERSQLERMDYSVNTAPPDNLRLIYIEETDKLENVNGDFSDESVRQLWRRQHAKLLRALADAPHLVAFDMVFDTTLDAAEYKQADADLGAAIREARTRVIVGAEVDEKSRPKLIDSVKSADWGLAHSGGFRLERGQAKGMVRRYILAQSTLPAGTAADPQPAIPSLAVRMLLTELGHSRSEPKSVQMDQGKRELILFSGAAEVKRISCDFELESHSPGSAPRLLATLPIHYPRTPEFSEEKYALVLKRLSGAAAEYRDKIVLIGAQLNKEVSGSTGGEKVLLTPDPEGRFAYGYQIHASVFSDLSQDTYARRLRGPWQFLVLLFLGSLAGIGGKILPRTDVEVDTKIFGTKPLPIGLVILFVIFFALVWVFYRSAFVLFDLGYGVLAVGIAYYLCGRALGGHRRARS